MSSRDLYNLIKAHYFISFRLSTTLCLKIIDFTFLICSKLTILYNEPLTPLNMLFVYLKAPYGYNDNKYIQI